MTTTTRKIPTPLYAAAGAGDLAYQQLRKLPAEVEVRVAQLRTRVEELRPAVTDAVSETNLRADLDRIRDAARRNASSLIANAQAGAQTAQDRAVAVYTDLVNRGEKVVAGARTEAKVEIEPAAKTVTAEVVVESAAEPVAAPVDAPPATPNTHAAKKTIPAKKATASKK